MQKNVRVTGPSIAATLVVAVGLSACAAGVGVDTAPQAQLDTAELVWPQPPDPPRIRYVGQLSSEADLGRKSSLFGRISRAVIGAQDGNLTLSRPTDVYAEDSTRVYVTDGILGKMYAFDFEKREVEVIGESGTGVLIKPMGLGGDGSGRVFVTDPPARRVVAFGPGGEFLKAFGGREVLINPVDVAVDSVAGRIYVVDSYLHQVVVFDEAGNVIDRLGKDDGDLAAKLSEQARRLVDTQGSVRSPHSSGSRDLTANRGGGPGEFLYPLSVSVSPDGKLYVTDGMNSRVQCFDNEGQYLYQFGRLGDTPGSFARPKGLTVSSEGHVYVVDAAFNNVQIFDAEGQLLLAFGSIGMLSGQMWLPLGIHIDSNNRIYVADRFNGRVQAFQYLGAPGLQVGNEAGVGR